MGGGEYDVPQDYITSRVEEAYQTAEQAAQASTISATGTTIGQFALWDGSQFVPATFFSGDGIGAAYTSTPSVGLQFSVNNAADLRTALGLAIKAIATGTVTVDPGSIAATTGGTVDVTITGVATDDTIILNPPALTAGLLYVGCRAQSANTVRIFLYNTTGAPIDEASASWRYTWIDAT